MLRDPALIPLSHDHQHALGLCVRIRRALTGDPPAHEDLARSVIHLFDSEMRRHFEQEEDILFPAMSGFESTRELVAELINDHGRIVSMVDTLRSAPAAERLADFAELVMQHVRREESVLFEEAQRLLSREDLHRIGTLLAGSSPV